MDAIARMLRRGSPAIRAISVDWAHRSCRNPALLMRQELPILLLATAVKDVGAVDDMWADALIIRRCGSPRIRACADRLRAAHIDTRIPADGCIPAASDAIGRLLQKAEARLARVSRRYPMWWLLQVVAYGSAELDARDANALRLEGMPILRAEGHIWRAYARRMYHYRMAISRMSVGRKNK